MNVAESEQLWSELFVTVLDKQINGGACVGLAQHV